MAALVRDEVFGEAIYAEASLQCMRTGSSVGVFGNGFGDSFNSAIARSRYRQFATGRNCKLIAIHDFTLLKLRGPVETRHGPQNKTI